MERSQCAESSSTTAHHSEAVRHSSAVGINLLGQNRFAVAAAWQSLVPTDRTAFLRGPIATSWRRCLSQRFHVAKELPMTVLRQRMTEDMQVRNLSPHTQASYLQQ